MEKKVLAILMIWLMTGSISNNRLCRAIWIGLPPSGPKCISEEIRSNVVVLADYSLINAASHEERRRPRQPPTNATASMSIKVTSPYGSTLHHRENVTEGRLAFTADESGSYLACFWLDDAGGREGSGGAGGGGEWWSVDVDWRTGIGAKDWESVARKERIEGVELELRKLLGGVEEVHKNLVGLKDREAEMRIVSERTNTRVALWSMMSLGICITVSAFQLLYLKQYFVKKKLV